MKTEVKRDSVGRQWGYLLLTVAELESLRKNITSVEGEEIFSTRTRLSSDMTMVPQGYELRGRKDRVFICVESKDEEHIAVTLKQLENMLNA